jgi:hypothetical protein
MLSPTASPTVDPATTTGTVHGGQTPVTGARIFLFEAAATGYGKPSVSDILPAAGTLDTTYNAYTAPTQYAIDQSGYAWSASGNLSSGNGQLIRYTPSSGQELLTSISAMLPTDVAIDRYGRIFVTDPAARKITFYNSDATFGNVVESGTNWTHARYDSVSYGNLISISALSSNVYVNGILSSAGGIYQPGNLSVDSAGAIWLANTNSSLSKVTINTNATVTGVSPANGYTGGGLASDSVNSAYSPVVMDGASNAWFPNYGNGSVSRFTTAGFPLRRQPATSWRINRWGSRSMGRGTCGLR